VPKQIGQTAGAEEIEDSVSLAWGALDSGREPVFTLFLSDDIKRLNESGRVTNIQ
jgi:hypothetical protein